MLWAALSQQSVLREHHSSGLSRKGFPGEPRGCGCHSCAWKALPHGREALEDAFRESQLTQQTVKAALDWLDMIVLPQSPAPPGQGEEMGVGRCRSTLRGSLPTHAGLGLFWATFSLSSFEINWLSPAPTTCHVSKERCGWLPATIDPPNYVKRRVKFLFQRETLTFSPQVLLANLC